jgi:hypothetical protein
VGGYRDVVGARAEEAPVGRGGRHELVFEEDRVLV